MDARLRQLIAFADRWIAAADLAVPERRRQAHIGLAIAGVFASQAVLFAGVYAHLAIPAAVGILGVAFGLLLATPWVMRRSSTWGNRYALAVVTCTLWSLAGVAGGPTSPAMYWTAAIPIIAMMTESVRAGLVWVAVCSAMPAFAHGLEHAGVVFGNLSAHQDRTLGVPAVGMLCIVVLSSGLLYERALATAFERIERTSNSMRFLLDHVDQGLVAVAPDGRPAGMRSAALETWFGRPRRDEDLAEWFGRTDARLGQWLGLGLPDVFADDLPTEVVIDQLPKRVERDGMHLALRYHPVLGEDSSVEIPRALLVMVTDATEHVIAERAQAAQTELLAFFAQVTRDRSGVIHFFDEAEHIVEELEAGRPRSLRLVHTLKGNASLFGLTTLARVCDAVESSAQEEGRPLNRPELDRVRAAWTEVRERIAPLLGRDDATLPVSETELREIERGLREGLPHAELLARVAELRHEPMLPLLERLGRHASALSERLDLGGVDVEVHDHGLRFDAERWDTITATLVHAVRNAVDHGRETEAQRLELGKPRRMQLRLTSERDGDVDRIVVEDDGAGIDWDAVGLRAEARGLHHGSRAELARALLSTGFSTRERATDVSGRGVGMSALRDAVETAGGRVEIESERGVGTRLTLWVPRASDEGARAA